MNDKSVDYWKIINMISTHADISLLITKFRFEHNFTAYHEGYKYKYKLKKSFSVIVNNPDDFILKLSECGLVSEYKRIYKIKEILKEV